MISPGSWWLFISGYYAAGERRMEIEQTQCSYQDSAIFLFNKASQNDALVNCQRSKNKSYSGKVLTLLNAVIKENILRNF